MTNSPYQALALDLDGTTLVGEDLPQSNKIALQRAAAAGYRVIIATARWREMAARIADEIGIEDPYIACSGAQVYDPNTRQDVFDERLPLEFTQALYSLCNQHRCIATITLADHVQLKLEGEPDRSLMSDEMHWVPHLELAADNVPRIAAVQGTQACAVIRAELEPQFADSVNIFDSVGPTGKLILTITSKRASKGHALRAACDHLDLSPEQVVAFGDAGNDLAMFEVAGASVAMGQADDNIKAAASFVSSNHDEGGVANAVNRLLDTGSL